MVALAAISTLPYRWVPSLLLSGDVTQTYYGAHQALVAHLLPYRQFRWEYPPGTLLNVWLPGVRLAPDKFLLVFIFQMLVLDAAILAGLRRLAHGNQDRVLPASWLWIAAGPALLAVPLVRNDLSACALVVWGFVALAERRFRLAGIVLAGAVLVKLWPAVILVAWLRRMRLGRRRLVTAAAGTTALCAGLLAWAGALGTALVYVGRYQGGRGLEVESTAAIPELWAAIARGAQTTFVHSYGSFGLAGSATAATVTTWLGALFMAAVLLHRGRQERGDLSSVAARSAAAVGILLLSAKVFSPQYLIWLVTVAACSAALGRFRWREGGLLLLTCALTGWIYPVLFPRLLTGDVLPVAVLSVRALVCGMFVLGVSRHWLRPCRV